MSKLLFMENEVLLKKRNTWLIILVASLGYFVDIYDLVVFSIVRIQSFKDIGISEELMRTNGEYVLNMQMAGLLIGGIIWGVIGDKFGRIKVLFGSILLYSIANILNAFVYDIHLYAFIRFFAGLGLAGELGAGVTLVNENMHKDKRGYGTMIIATVGVLGAVAAFYVAEHFSWRNTYIVGGGLGIVLLILRLGTFESGMFQRTMDSSVPKGKISMLFNNKERFWKYIYCLLIGLPLWYVIGILITQAPEFGKVLGARETLSAGKGILFSYIGISIGDLLAGLFAQITKSRRLTVFIFQVSTLFATTWYLSSYNITAELFNWIAFFLGLSVGYWATFVTIASEQFGTNLRSTVTTTAPNFARGSLILSTFLFELFVHFTSLISAAYIMIFLLTAVSLFAISKLKESFNKDLDYVETP
ncbi:MAG: MFS transporter [Crocinitomicaceae bacterium]|nr:MFS transporter [Crocinitomicaceae bacterium]